MIIGTAAKVVLVAIVCITAVGLVGFYVPYRKKSATESQEICFPVRRDQYLTRHLQWYGFFPVYGWFRPHPDFRCSDVMTAPRSIQRITRKNDLRYQLIDVNPFFSDDSCEVLLAFQSNGELLEYNLANTKEALPWAVPSYPSEAFARLFEYHGKIAVLVSIGEKSEGIYLVNLPLQTGAPLRFISAGSPEFEAAGQEVANFRNDVDLRAHFCSSRRKPLIEFFEQYCGPCDEPERK